MFSNIEFDTVLAAGVLCFTSFCVVKGFLIWKKDQDRQAAEYWREECAIQEYEIQFMKELNSRLVPRLVSRFGADFQEYLIARNIAPPQLEKPEPEIRTIRIHQYDPTRPPKPSTTEKEIDEEPKESGYSIEECQRRMQAVLDRRIAEQKERERREAEKAEREQAIQRERAAQEWQRQQEREKRGYTPPNMGRPMPQAPHSNHRQPQIFLPSFVVDDDILDAEYTEIHRAAKPQQPSQAKNNKGGGRPRKYNTAAERQAAYRERKRALECN